MCAAHPKYVIVQGQRLIISRARARVPLPLLYFFLLILSRYSSRKKGPCKRGRGRSRAADSLLVNRHFETSTLEGNATETSRSPFQVAVVRLRLTELDLSLRP